MTALDLSGGPLGYTTTLVDMADFATVNAIYGEKFTNDPPARSTVAVAGLPRNVRVEIEAVAVI